MRTDAADRDTTDVVDERAERRARLLRAIRYSVGVFLVLRVALALVSLAGVGLLPSIGNEVGVAGWPPNPVTPGLHNLVTAWERFDGLWFLGIATQGYDIGGQSAVFFPAYPLAIRALSPVLGGHPLAAALVISHLAALGSFVLLYLLTATEYDEAVARRAVVYLAVFPTSFFLIAPYSESLFLLLVLATMLAARRGRWAIAGAAALLAATTRNLGVLLAAPLVVEAVQQASERGRRSLLRSLPWAIGPVLGLGAYLLFWHLSAGEWLAPVLEQQGVWQRRPTFPLVTLWRGTAEAFRFVGAYPGGYHLLDWLVVVPALAGAVWVALRARPLYGVYTWLSLLAPLSVPFIPRPLMSVPRFLVVVFPILWAPAAWSARRPGVGAGIVAVSAALLGLMTVLFVNWYYVF